MKMCKPLELPTYVPADEASFWQDVSAFSQPIVIAEIGQKQQDASSEPNLFRRRVYKLSDYSGVRRGSGLVRL